MTTRVICACLFILAGGLAAQHSRVPLDSDLCVLLLVAVVVLLSIRRIRLVGYVLFGFGWFMLAAASITTARLDARISGDSLLTQVRIVDFPKLTGRSVSMVVAPIADARLPPRSRVSWIEPAEIPAMGEIWQLELRLRRPRGKSNPGTFDLEAWMFREKLHAAGYVVSGKRNRRLADATFAPLTRYRVETVRRAVSGSSTPESAAVLAAITVGTRHLITREQWHRYAITGTSHLMAISGLHVGLASAAGLIVLTLLLGGLRLPGNHLIQAIVGSVVLAFAYAGVSGFAVPARRAVIMLLFGAAAVLCRRRPQAGHLVAISAIVVFILDPVSSMSPGFHLSFAAVVVLLWHARGSNASIAAARRFGRLLTTVRQVAAMQGALLFGLLPFTVIFFQRVAVLAPLVNFLTVPVFSFVTVPLALLAMLVVGVWDGAAMALLQLAARSVDFTESIVRTFAAFPAADIRPAGLRGGALCLLLLSVLWIVLPRRWPGRSVAAIALVAVVLHQPARPPQACFDTHILDVGQGLAAVIQSRNHALLFDTAVAYRNGGSAAEQNILPFLRFRGIRQLDWLIVSHADNDHAGGVDALRRNIGIGRVLVGEPIFDDVLKSEPCSAGQIWQVDGVTFRMLHPRADREYDGNDASCVLEVAVGQYRLLLTGDIEGSAEAALLRGGALQRAAVVVIPHHGSSTSSTSRFVKVLSPRFGIVSAGYENRWGFPKKAIVARWQGTGARVLNTATSGAISLRMCQDSGIVQLTEQRPQQHRFWRDRAP